MANKKKAPNFVIPSLKAAKANKKLHIAGVSNFFGNYYKSNNAVSTSLSPTNNQRAKHLEKPILLNIESVRKGYKNDKRNNGKEEEKEGEERVEVEVDKGDVDSEREEQENGKDEEKELHDDDDDEEIEDYEEESEEDSALFYNSHLSQLNSALNRERIRRENCEQEILLLKKASSDSSLLAYTSTRIEELNNINMEQYKEIKNTFESYKIKLDELELRINRFVNALDNSVIMEEVKSHISSLTINLKDSRNKEIKYIETNSLLMLHENNNMLETIQSQINSQKKDKIKEEISNLERLLQDMEQKLTEQQKFLPLLYQSSTSLKDGRLRDMVEQALCILKIKHQGELKSLQSIIGEIEVGYLKGNFNEEELCESFSLIWKEKGVEERNEHS